MSKSMASKNAEKANLKSEVEILTMALEDALVAFSTLMVAAEFSVAVAEDACKANSLHCLGTIKDNLEAAMVMCDYYITMAKQGREDHEERYCNMCGSVSVSRFSGYWKCDTCANLMF